jgi:hypothetical protein
VGKVHQVDVTLGPDYYVPAVVYRLLDRIIMAQMLNNQGDDPALYGSVRSKRVVIPFEPRTLV